MSADVLTALDLSARRIGSATDKLERMVQLARLARDRTETLAFAEETHRLYAADMTARIAELRRLFVQTIFIATIGSGAIGASVAILALHSGR